MKFELIDSIEVTAHIQDVANKTTNHELKQNILGLLSELRNGTLIAYHGFQNEYGERYLMLGKDMSKWWWAGSESDWIQCSSYWEDKFVNLNLALDKAKIQVKKENTMSILEKIEFINSKTKCNWEIRFHGKLVDVLVYDSKATPDHEDFNSLEEALDDVIKDGFKEEKNDQ